MVLFLSALGAAAGLQPPATPARRTATSERHTAVALQHPAAPEILEVIAPTHRRDRRAATTARWLVRDVRRAYVMGYVDLRPFDEKSLESIAFLVSAARFEPGLQGPTPWCAG